MKNSPGIFGTRCWGIFLLLTASACAPDRSGPADQTDGPAVFRLLSPEESGVTFQNTLEEGLNTNILMYEYFFNGGGVAVADFNGDTLPDLYFTSNMGANKLYIQERRTPSGGLRFRDLTGPSGAGGRPGPWKTGVNVADVNGDGRPDIYLCYSGALPDEKRKNQLFIHQGNDADGVPRFEDQAAAYGLDSPAFSTQSYFLDYDRDGDLDLFLLNHHPKNLPILNEQKTAELFAEDAPLYGLRLFRQDQGRFTDVTVAAGINGSALSYGLGLGIGDLNQDGWPDCYVSNDYAVPDYLYINQGDGTFRNLLSRMVGHTSQFSMGNDLADLNNDGRTDIFTLDMLPEDNRRQKLLMAPDNYGKFDLHVRSGFYYQYMRNMLHLNNGNGTFSETGQWAGVSNTDWSWSVLAADYDNDGWKDLYITNGYFRDFTNLDFINYMDDFVRQKGRLVREDVLEVIRHMPSSNVVNYLFQGRPDRPYIDRTKDWGLALPSNSNGAAYADLDLDGDLDLVVNNIQRPAFLFENLTANRKDAHFLRIRLQGETPNTQGIGARIQVFTPQGTQVLEQFPARGYQSAVSDVLHFGLGGVQRVDSLRITWPRGTEELLRDIPADQEILLRESQAQAVVTREVSPPPAVFRAVPPPLNWRHLIPGYRDFDRQALLLSEFSPQGPCMATTDLDGDGRQDLFIGGGAGQAGVVYFQQADGAFRPSPQPDLEADRAAQDADAAFLDADGDGLPDLLVASGGYHQFDAEDTLLQDRLYLNDGKGRFRRSRAALPAMPTSTGCIATADIDGDGAVDLFLGGRVIPGRYPEPPASYLLLNDGKGRFLDRTQTLAPDLARIGMVCDAEWADLDQDRKPELVLAGDCLPLTVFRIEDGKLRPDTDRWFPAPVAGMWNTLRITDLNQDGWPDLLAGNIGTNVQFKPSPAEPATLYYGDFDENGSVDPLFCYPIQGKSYPFVTRDELLRQLAPFRSRFTDYKSYADATLEDFLRPDQLDKAGKWTINHTRTSLFLGGAEGFSEQALPEAVQYAPVYAFQLLDYNLDGHTDLLVAGNNSRFKLRIGKADANLGMLLAGDGTGRFRYVGQPESGLSIRGDVRSLALLGDLLLVGLSGEAVQAYRWTARPEKPLPSPQ